MSWTIHEGHALDVLARLPEKSVDCCITSPPYWSLREFDVPPTIWGGDPKCKHKWMVHIRPAANGSYAGMMKEGGMRLDSATRRPQASDFCAKCNAWRGQLGLEPTPKLYVEHLASIFAAVQRVLKPGRTIWLNMGDTWYSAAGNGRTMGGSNFDHYRRTQKAKVGGYPKLPPSRLRIEGLKGKDLVGVPWMTAFALRDLGLWLRSEVIWHKPNGIAKVADDRPAGIHETIFLFSNAKKYYYDELATREPQSEHERTRRLREGAKGSTGKNYELKRDKFRDSRPPGSTSMMRSLDKRIELAVSGVRRRRSVWNIACSPYSGNHSATFPLDLAEIMVKAGCPEGGVVLDPFCGAGTVGLMAARMSRHFVGIEASAATVEEARARILGDAPMVNSGLISTIKESAQTNLF